MSVERNATRQRILIVLACFGAVILLTNLALVTATDFGLRIEKLPLPAVLGGKTKDKNLGLPVGYGILLILDGVLAPPGLSLDLGRLCGWIAPHPSCPGLTYLPILRLLIGFPKP